MGTKKVHPLGYRLGVSLFWPFTPQVLFLHIFVFLYVWIVQFFYTQKIYLIKWTLNKFSSAFYNFSIYYFMKRMFRQLIYRRFRRFKRKNFRFLVSNWLVLKSNKLKFLNKQLLKFKITSNVWLRQFYLFRTRLKNGSKNFKFEKIKTNINKILFKIRTKLLINCFKLKKKFLFFKFLNIPGNFYRIKKFFLLNYKTSHIYSMMQKMYLISTLFNFEKIKLLRFWAGLKHFFNFSLFSQFCYFSIILKDLYLHYFFQYLTYFKRKELIFLYYKGRKQKLQKYVLFKPRHLKSQKFKKLNYLALAFSFLGNFTYKQKINNFIKNGFLSKIDFQYFQSNQLNFIYFRLIKILKRFRVLGGFFDFCYIIILYVIFKQSHSLRQWFRYFFEFLNPHSINGSQYPFFWLFATALTHLQALTSFFYGFRLEVKGKLEGSLRTRRLSFGSIIAQHRLFFKTFFEQYDIGSYTGIINFRFWLF